MIEEVIKYLNTKLTSSGYFNTVFPLVKRIEREGLIYPSVYNDNNEYVNINLDSESSLSYWRLNSDVSYAEQPSTTTVGNEYATTIPLRLVFFLKKDLDNNTVYFEDNFAQTIIKLLSTNSSALKIALKAKRINIVGTNVNTDGRIVASEEYQKIDFEPRYNYAYCTINFNVQIITNNSCLTDICTPAPELHCGVVRIVDVNGNLIATVDCGDDYIVGTSCLDATVSNSNDSYQVSVASGAGLVLSDITYIINVNDVLNQTFDVPSMENETINITN